MSLKNRINKLEADKRLNNDHPAAIAIFSGNGRYTDNQPLPYIGKGVIFHHPEASREEIEALVSEHAKLFCNL